MARSGSTSLSDADTESVFGELSAILAGAGLPAAAVRRHLKTVQQAANAGDLERALHRFRKIKEGQANLVEAVEKQLVKDAELGPLVKNIILLWFTGQMPGARGPAGQDDYFEALMWSAVGAHPPGMSDAYFGHWRYPPDEGGP